MTRNCKCALVLILLTLAVELALPRYCAAEGPGMTLAGSKWIWFPEGNPAADAPFEPRYFRRTFDLPAGTHVAIASE